MKKESLHLVAQLSALQELLINDHYLYLDAELNIISYSNNCINFSENILNVTISDDINIQELLLNIEEDFSIFKFQNFFLNNIEEDEVTKFKFQIGGKLILLSLLKISEHNIVSGYMCIMESHPHQNDTKETFEYKQLVANISWFTSHKLRGPLSTILSLIDQNLLPEAEDPQQLEVLLTQMKHYAMSLDDALHTLNNLLSSREKTTPIVAKLAERNLKNILMLDDNILTHKICAKMMSNINPEINLFSFTAGIEALEFLHTFPTDLILLDLDMPEMNGWEFLNFMQKKGINIPTIIVSSSIDAKDLSRSLEYNNVKGFIHKPITNADLKSILANSLQTG